MGITPTGYQRRTLDVILETIQDALRGKISAKLDLTEKEVLGNTSNIDAARIDELEQLVEECYNAQDPDNASDDRFVAIALQSGVPRRGATKGLVTAKVNLNANKSFNPGDLAAYVQDEPTNRWLNRDAVVSTTAGYYYPVFISENAGATAVAEATTLNQIATPVSGWNSITNEAAATPGTDIESIAALRIRREQSLSLAGSRTRGSIQAKLVAIDGVISARVFDNTGNTIDANGIGPHSLMAVVWDGSPAAADDNALAQAIWDSKPEGILSQGTVQGIAQDDDLGPVSVFFNRATPSSVTISVTVESATGVASDDVKAALVAVMPTRVGDPVIYHKLAAALFSVAGLDDYSAFTVNGGTADLPGVQNQIYILAAGDISVSGDVT